MTALLRPILGLYFLSTLQEYAISALPYQDKRLVAGLVEYSIKMLLYSKVEGLL